MKGEHLESDHSYVESKIQSYLAKTVDFGKVTSHMSFRPPLHAHQANFAARRVGQSRKDSSSVKASTTKTGGVSNGKVSGKGKKSDLSRTKGRNVPSTPQGGKKRSRSGNSMVEEYRLMTKRFMKSWRSRNEAVKNDQKSKTPKKPTKTSKFFGFAGTLLQPKSHFYFAQPSYQRPATKDTSLRQR